MEGFLSILCSKSRRRVNRGMNSNLIRDFDGWDDYCTLFVNASSRLFSIAHQKDLDCVVYSGTEGNLWQLWWT